jgi:hypothetical protein
VWFDQATKQRQRIIEDEDLWNDRDDNDNSDDSDSVPNTSSTSDDTSRKEISDAENEGTNGLRNVRWSVEQTESYPGWISRWIAQQATETDFWSLNMDLDSPASSSASSLDSGSHPIDSNRPRSRKPAITTGLAPSGANALEEYQMKLMRLEQRNKKRLIRRREILHKTLAKMDNLPSRGAPTYFEGAKTVINLALPEKKRRKLDSKW